MEANAKECSKAWDCEGPNRCYLDCKSRYNGKGICNPPITPFAPYQCDCVWNC
ncbi:hypothetical protein LINGRAHAP2_LOCUS13057 [Linum grandiflorum]